MRLAAPPSLVLLNGNNENLWGYEDWGWKLRLDGKTWGAYYYYELFPRLIAELAPHVPYAPGSPFSPGAARRRARGSGRSPMQTSTRTTRRTARCTCGSCGTAATARPTASTRPRFVAEFGWQGPPAWTTLTRAISDDPLTPESPGMIVHQKADGGQRQADQRPRPALPRAGRHGDLALGDAAQPGRAPCARRSSTSARGRRTPWARSSGSSTTAGPSPRGRRSTATSAPSPSSTP